LTASLNNMLQKRLYEVSILLGYDAVSHPRKMDASFTALKI
jgi:hypothetical protein